VYNTHLGSTSNDGEWTPFMVEKEDFYLKDGELIRRAGAGGEEKECFKGNLDASIVRWTICQILSKLLI